MPIAGVKRRRAPEGGGKAGGKAGGAKGGKSAGGKAGGAKGAGGGGGSGGKPAPRKGPPKQSYYEKVATSKPAKDADDDYDKADELDAPAAKRRVAPSGKAAAAAPAKQAARDAGDDGDAGSVDDSAAAGGGAPASGFAAAMAKVLGRSLSSANPVLAKRHTAGQKIAAKRAADVKEVKLKAREKKAARRAHLAAPEAAPADYERQLRKVATKGVVSLFNTIAKHQKAVAAATATQDAKVKETRAAAEEERLRPSATSHSFLDLLHQNTAAASSKPSAFEGGASSSSAAAAGGKWAVLRDDYLSSGKAAKAAAAAADDGDGDDLPDILDSDDE